MLRSFFRHGFGRGGDAPMRLLLVGLLAALAGCGSDEPAAPPLPDVSGLQGSIAYVCEHEDGDNDELCLMDANGLRIRRLTDNPGPDRAPNWSPDGRSLVFNSRRAPHADRPQIYRHDVATGQAARITSGSGEDQRASWSPDGKAIVFQRGDFTIGYEIHRQALDGTAPVALTDYPGRIQAAAEYAPDGRRLVLQSNRDAEAMFPFSSYLLDTVTGAMVRLAASVTASHDGPRWSPDGERIAFAAGGDLYVLRVADGSVTRITDDDHSDSAPDWSPDGTMLVFQSDREDEDRTTLHVIDLQTRAIGNLGPGRTPVWTARVF